MLNGSWLFSMMSSGRVYFEVCTHFWDLVVG
jgi:hypothetical protein